MIIIESDPEFVVSDWVNYFFVVIAATSNIHPFLIFLTPDPKVRDTNSRVINITCKFFICTSKLIAQPKIIMLIIYNRRNKSAIYAFVKFHRAPQVNSKTEYHHLTSGAARCIVVLAVAVGTAVVALVVVALVVAE